MQAAFVGSAPGKTKTLDDWLAEGDRGEKDQTEEESGSEETEEETDEETEEETDSEKEHSEGNDAESSRQRLIPPG